MPLVFADGMTPAQLLRLSQAYRHYASYARRSVLLRAVGGPLAQAEADNALQVADHLVDLCQHKAMTECPPSDWLLLQGSHPNPAVRRTGASARIVASPSVGRGRFPSFFAAVQTSFIPYRLEQRDPTRPTDAPESVVDELDADLIHHHLLPVEAPVQAPAPVTGGSSAGDETDCGVIDDEFNGVLSRLQGPGWRHEYDPASGRQRLHLSLAETTHKALRQSQRSAPPAGELAVASARLMSLGLMLLDRGDNAVLICRSTFSTFNPGMFAASVSGSLEMQSRSGLVADKDEHGLPDPVTGMSRELREELGLTLDPRVSAVRVNGLIQVRTEGDYGTYVLIGTASLPLPWKDLRIPFELSDEIEGRWEVGSEALIVHLQEATRSPQDFADFLVWLRTYPDLTAHGVGALALIAGSRLKHQSAAKVVDTVLEAEGTRGGQLTGQDSDTRFYTRVPLDSSGRFGAAGAPTRADHRSVPAGDRSDSQPPGSGG
ncbi:MAG: hypothetical protein Q4G67_13805 [Actinomycetia bacterium]|nr:hypothetical protein [Actinomycetes bacterium]